MTREGREDPKVPHWPMVVCSGCGIPLGVALGQLPEDFCPHCGARDPRMENWRPPSPEQEPELALLRTAVTATRSWMVSHMSGGPERDPKQHHKLYEELIDAVDAHARFMRPEQPKPPCTCFHPDSPHPDPNCPRHKDDPTWPKGETP